MMLFEQGDYLFSFDLKSGYHHVDIAEIHQKYLGFKWQQLYMYYEFTCLAFWPCKLCVICSLSSCTHLSTTGVVKASELLCI